MTRFEILSILRAGGATLNKDGESVHHTRGYQVSRKDCYTLDVNHVDEILQAVNGLLENIAPGEFVGVWVDDSKAYIDISERIDRLSDAMRAGIERKQKTIFDWCCNRCIACA